jgi:uncharacterized protein YneR
MESTHVIFLVHPLDDEAFAYFPNEFYFKEDSELRSCYARIGQHSACHPSYASESRQATPEEYLPLKEELESIGYKLKILNYEICNRSANRQNV